MAVVHSPESAYAREMTKWEARDGPLGPGLRPYVRRDYPMMLHKAVLRPQGGIEISDRQIVEDETQRSNFERLGFRATPLEAIEALTAQQTEHATLAAERTFEVRRMSPKAQREVAQHEAAAGAQHLPTIPETPIGPRGIRIVPSESATETALANADETISTQQATIEELTAKLAALQAVPARAPKRRGRPAKKITPPEAS